MKQSYVWIVSSTLRVRYLDIDRRSTTELPRHKYKIWCRGKDSNLRTRFELKPDGILRFHYFVDLAGHNSNRNTGGDTLRIAGTPLILTVILILSLLGLGR